MPRRTVSHAGVPDDEQGIRLEFASGGEPPRPAPLPSVFATATGGGKDGA